MSASWPKILRDPIHNLIAFHNTDWDRLLLALIDTKGVSNAAVGAFTAAVQSELPKDRLLRRNEGHP